MIINVGSLSVTYGYVPFVVSWGGVGGRVPMGCSKSNILLSDILCGTFFRVISMGAGGKNLVVVVSLVDEDEASEVDVVSGVLLIVGVEEDAEEDDDDDEDDDVDEDEGDDGE